MLLTIELHAIGGQDIVVPLQYNHMVQALIYNSLDPEFADFLHDHGYDGAGRKFKLFCFSRIMGKYQKTGNEIKFQSPVQLIVISPVERFCQSLISGLLTKNELRLADTTVIVTGIAVDNPRVEEEMVRLKMLSPVVVYSTMLRLDKRKYTCYFQPGERDFTEKVAENLRKKYLAVYHSPAPEGEIQIRPFSQPKLHVIKYKGIIVKGYTGILEIRGPRDLLQIVVDAGLGSKNSMGFGCVEIISKGRK